MQTIAHRTEEATRELGIRVYVGLNDLVHTLVARARDPRGQTAAEYMGILLIVAVIIGALATSGIGGKIKDLTNGMIDHTAKGDQKPPA
jgi:Flp pilus assembly pilin Flp